jgi:NADPH-dependent curcumin reductase CurA
MTISREVRLKRRPVGLPTAEDFELAVITLPPPEPGEVQVRNTWMTVDPYMRGRMADGPSYAAPFALGEVMSGTAIGEVVVSNDDRLKPGDLVRHFAGWREAFNAPADHLQILDTMGLPAQHHLGAAGMPGLTAYIGLMRIAAFKPGDTVFVSGAAGAVGSMVVQIAKLKGGRVIGTAGGAAKIAFLKEIGVDHAIDYRAVSDLTEAVLEAAGEGIDVYFDNVGGAHLEAALDAAKTHARFAICGGISGYNSDLPAPGPRNFMMTVRKQLRIEGFLTGSHQDLAPEFAAIVPEWIRSGKVQVRETVDHGIENAVPAFLKLFTGGNLGKMLVKL